MLGRGSSLIYCDAKGVIRRVEDNGPISQTLAKEILARPEMVMRYAGGLKISEAAE